MSAVDVMGAPAVEGDLSARRERLLFGSDALIVRAIETDRRDVAFVTFDSYTDARTLDRPGFGEHFFAARGISAVHVISRENRWYQHAEMHDVLNILARWSAGYDRVIAYGSSMGGFAALTYGAAGGAHAAIALSPQFSVDPQVVPFEDRWLTEVAKIDFEPGLPSAELPTQCLVYDPRDAYDPKHAALFAKRSQTIVVRAPFGGHPVGAFLNEAGLLEPLIEQVASGTFDPAHGPAMEQALRAGRRRSGQYLFTLAQAVPDYRPRQKLALARMAAEAQPDNPVYKSFHAAMLDLHGRLAEAYPIHLAACALPTAGPHTDWRLLMHHRLKGELAEAERLGVALAAEHPDSPLFRVTLEGVWRERRRLTRLGRLVTALRLEPVVDHIARRGWRVVRAWRARRSSDGHQF